MNDTLQYLLNNGKKTFLVLDQDGTITESRWNEKLHSRNIIDDWDRTGELGCFDTFEGIMKKEIPCTACGLCVPQCPMELNIPALLEKYNEIFFDSKPAGKAAASASNSDVEAARKFTGELTPGACIGCGHCMLICPVGIGVPALLHELAAGKSERPMS